MNTPAPRDDDLFAELLSLSAAERADRLEQIGRIDPAMRDRLGALLEVNECDADFLQEPIGGPLVPLAEEKSGDIIGRYRLIRKLGEGGYGMVYLAAQTEAVRREVALKVIKLGMDTRAVMARFEVERQTLALMNHADIARVYDAGTTSSGRLYFVMEYVDGAPITTFCDDHLLDLTSRLTLFVRICLALQHAHQKGIIHRDIKPSNILVAMEDGLPAPKVIDFGIAKATQGRLGTETPLTEADQLMGTPIYMSPEQVDRREYDVDTRSDVYGLGVLLYELLTGRPPFDRDTINRAGLDDVRRIIREVVPPRPSQRLATLTRADEVELTRKRRTVWQHLRSNLRGDLDWIAMRCLEKDRDRRYPSAQELAEDVRRFLRREPVLARPPTALYQIDRFVSRHRIACASVTAAALILVAATIVSVRMTWRALDAELVARRQAETVAAVNAFLVEDLLRQADSNAQADAKETPKPDLKVREALDRAAAKVGGRFEALPIAEAGVRFAIGQSYIGIGQAGAAEPQLRRAWELRQSELGRDHPDALAAGLLLARSYVDQGRHQDAATLQTEILEIQTERFGRNYPPRYETINELADSYDVMGRYAESAALQEEAYAFRRDALGADHPDTLLSMSNLGNAYLRLRRFDEALELQERALIARQNVLGADHPATLNTMSNLAETLVQLQRIEEARAMQQELLERTRRVLGGDHFQTIATLVNIAGLLRDQEDYVQAEGLLREALAAAERSLGADHPFTLTALNNLATIYGLTGRPEKALPLKEQLRGAVEKVFGAEHPNTTIATFNLGVTYADLGRYEEGIAIMTPLFEPLLAFVGENHLYRRRLAGKVAESHAALKQWEEAAMWRQRELAIARQTDGLEQDQVMGVAALLATDLLAIGEFVEVETLLREVLAFREQEKPDDWTTFNSRSVLGEALLGLQRFDEAASYLVKGYEGLRAREAAIPESSRVRLAEARDRLLRWEEATGRRLELEVPPRPAEPR